MSEIKAIETNYKGYRMRSRLEARWAIFFDALNIKWEYETEGYVLKDGTHYLPDFHLPTFENGIYVEVKPTGGDFSKAIQFAKEARRKIWLAEGTPDCRAYDVWSWDWNYDENEESFCKYNGCPNADQAFGENRMYAQPGYENEDNSIDESRWSYLGDWYLEAVNAAKSARFEHGENPLVKKEETSFVIPRVAAPVQTSELYRSLNKPAQNRTLLTRLPPLDSRKPK